jgi:hypothetical protein
MSHSAASAYGVAILIASLVSAGDVAEHDPGEADGDFGRAGGLATL